MESLANIAKDTFAKKNPFPRLKGFAENGDACHWGFSELYPESEKVLRKAIEEKATFDTGWVGCKKEICSFRIISNGKIVTIQTHAEMDEIEDLIDDATPNGVELTDEQREEILNLWYVDTEMQTETGDEKTIPLTTYEDIIKCLVAMGNTDIKVLHNWYVAIQDWIKLEISNC